MQACQANLKSNYNVQGSMQCLDGNLSLESLGCFGNFESRELAKDISLLSEHEICLPAAQPLQFILIFSLISLTQRKGVLGFWGFGAVLQVIS